MKLSEFDASSWLIVAQEGAADAAADATADGGFPTLPFPVLIVIMFALFYFIILKPQQSKDRNFRSMLESLKEKDRVVTIGGIHGVVTNVQRDRDEVTLRIDESTGTKIRVGLSAISRLASDDDKSEKS
ncbi:MAG: preprotein translocase subunit YajC [Bythopirellula sp.]